MTTPIDDQPAAAGATEELFEMTRELGDTLKSYSESDPYRAPSAMAARVFDSWVVEAGPVSKRPDCFVDVHANYQAADNTNRDLFDLFNMLSAYIEFPEPEVPEKIFIGLPVL